MAFRGDRLRELREDSDFTQVGLGAKMHVDGSTISNWEKGRSRPNDEQLGELAELFHTTTDYLLDTSDQRYRPKTQAELYKIPGEELRPVPVLGTIPAGTPMLVQEDEREYLFLPAYLLPKGEVYVLHVKGDSMSGGSEPICDGDMAIIRREDDFVDNDVYATRVNGDEVTLKRVHIHDGYINLLPDNPDFQPSIHRTDDVEILGKLIWTMRRRGK